MALEEIPIPASSHIQAVLYDADQMMLIVSFKKATYVYLKVPGDVAFGFSNALSAGDYLNQNVKPLYEYQKMGD